MAQSTTLLGDIGGTNARFALLQGDQIDAQSLKKYRASDYRSMSDCIACYLELVGAAVDTACFAVAGNIKNTQFQFTNNPWQFTAAELRNEIDVDRLLIIHDFTAQALGISQSEAADLTPIVSGKVHPTAPKLVLGPGTGLGVSALIPSEKGPIALTGEGGFARLQAQSDRELALLNWMRGQIGEVIAEHAISGTGLKLSFKGLCELDNVECPTTDPEHISMLAKQGHAQALEALDLLMTQLGGLIGDYALMLGALGGVYIGGGVVPKIIETTGTQRLLDSMRARGRMSDYFDGVPIYLVDNDLNALHGCRLALSRRPTLYQWEEK